MMNSFQDGIIYGLRELGYDKIMGNQRRFVEALCGWSRCPYGCSNWVREESNFSNIATFAFISHAST
jgi:hypothetical protein